MISQIIGLILDERKFIKICQYISNLYLSLNLSKLNNYSSYQFLVVQTTRENMIEILYCNYSFIEAFY